MPGKPKTKPANPDEFDAIFARLRAILAPYARTLRVVADEPNSYYLETREKLYKNKPVFFAAVRKGKAYVSFHFIPIYAYPSLRQSLSPALRKRMQGKSCFNFTAVDKELFRELKTIAKRGAEGFPEKMLRGLPGA